MKVLTIHSTNMLRATALAAVTAIAFALVASAQPSVSGQEVAGPATLELSSGLMLSVPAGWRAAAADGATANLVGPDRESMIIATVKPVTREAVAAQLAAPIDLGRGIVLTPMSPPQVANDYDMADFTVAGTAKPARAVVLIKTLPDGRGFALVGIAPIANVENLREVQRQIMAASQIRAPAGVAPSAGAAAPSGAGGWAAYMRGRYLARFYSGSGYHEKHELWFCSDGTFASATDGGGFTAGVASGAFAGNSRGTWTATGETSVSGIITLVRTGGQRGQVQVQMGSDGLYLNGERWLRGDNKRCE